MGKSARKNAPSRRLDMYIPQITLQQAGYLRKPRGGLCPPPPIGSRVNGWRDLQTEEHLLSGSVAQWGVIRLQRAETWSELHCTCGRQFQQIWGLTRISAWFLCLWHKDTWKRHTIPVLTQDFCVWPKVQNRFFVSISFQWLHTAGRSEAIWWQMGHSTSNRSIFGTFWP